LCGLKIKNPTKSACGTYFENNIEENTITISCCFQTGKEYLKEIITLEANEINLWRQGFTLAHPRQNEIPITMAENKTVFEMKI